MLEIITIELGTKRKCNNGTQNKKVQDVTYKRIRILVPTLNQKLNGSNAYIFAHTNDEFREFLD